MHPSSRNFNGNPYGTREFGNFNADYAPGGAQADIGVGFGDIAWHMASEAMSPTPVFERVELIGDGQGRR